MSKRFKSQDYFRYKKLGTRWRRPVGRHSKMKIQKGGSPALPRIGYRTPKSVRFMSKVSDNKGASLMVSRTIHSISELDGISSSANASVRPQCIIITSKIGSRKALEISEKAKQLGMRVINSKKIKRAEKIAKNIKLKKNATPKEEESKHN